MALSGCVGDVRKAYVNALAAGGLMTVNGYQDLRAGLHHGTGLVGDFKLARNCA